MINLSKIKSDYLSNNKPFIERKKHSLEIINVLRNCDVIDSTSLEQYIARDGYFGLQKALEYTCEEVVTIVKDSNVRGRGGVGFNAGLKWNFARKEINKKKYFICNADEGEPGTYMDGYLLEHDPHSVIEGMLIGAYAIGANQGYIYLRIEYPIAKILLEKAIEEALEAGLLGKNIMDSGFNFDLQVRMGAGAYICGEETALIESLEGKRGMSRNKPPFPAVEGLFGKPTVVNNVETLSNIPNVLKHGSEWFKNVALHNNEGTKLISVSGKVKYPGIYEIPLGMKIGVIINDLCGGMKEGSKFKAVLTGGPGGGILTSDHFEEEFEFDNMLRLGSMLGSGSLIIIDQTICVVDIVKLYMDFNRDESCGKCTPCREGTIILSDLLEHITNGTGTMQDIIDIKHLSTMVTTSSLCGLGQSAPSPVMSAFKHFYDEFLDHVNNNHCSAGVCEMKEGEVNES